MEAYLPGMARSTLIYLHVVFVVLAAVAVAFADFAILRGGPIDRRLLDKARQAVVLTLVALWLTGLGVFALDVASVGMANAMGAKMRAKLCVVLALSVNGWVLHRFCFDGLVTQAPVSPRGARRSAVCGAISAASWVYALFLGVAREWTPLLGYKGFMALYAVALAAAIAISLRWVVPILMADRLSSAIDAALEAGNVGLGRIRVAPRDSRIRRARSRRR